MTIQKLFAILVALAVVFAPAFTRAGEAFAAVPDHHTQLMEAEHCQDGAARSESEGEAAAESCCVSMCTAVAVTFTSVTSARDVIMHPPAIFRAPTFVVGIPAEIATPPPRLA